MYPFQIDKCNPRGTCVVPQVGNLCPSALQPEHTNDMMLSMQSFTLWQEATIDITQWDHFIIACSRDLHGCYS